MALNKSLAMLTEFSYNIGSGHLLESMELYRAAKKKGFKVVMCVSAGSPRPILDRLKSGYIFFRNLNSGTQPERIREILLKNGCGTILFNFRKITNNILNSFQRREIKRVCIDELGNRSLNCDVIINPVIVEKYHRYDLKSKDIKVYSGPGYLPLNPGFAEIHRKNRVFKDEIRAISVCMGGVDRTGATLRLIDILAKWRRDALKNIILGGSFRYAREARMKIKRYPGRNFRLFQNVANMAYFFTESDVAFTAGGNTLYELACCGTPAIVLYEDGHEKENGLAFQKRGFGYCLGRGFKAGEEEILGCLKKLEDPQIRQRHSRNGKKIVDGRGSERVVKILSDLTKTGNGKFF